MNVTITASAAPVLAPFPETTSDCRERAARATSPRVREYWEKGFIALHGLFSTEEIAGWSAECDRLLQLELVTPKNLRTPFRMKSTQYPERIDPVVDISPLFNSLVKDPRIVGFVEEIFEDRAYLFKDKIIVKAPGTEGYTPHQDQAWWQLCSPDDILSVSIQIDGASAENGCIELFAGCHDHLITPLGLRTNFRPGDTEKIAHVPAQKMETIPGDVLIFHSLAPHQSFVNRANVFRRSLYLTYSSARSGDLYEKLLTAYKGYTAEADMFYR